MITAKTFSLIVVLMSLMPRPTIAQTPNYIVNVDLYLVGIKHPTGRETAACDVAAKAILNRGNIDLALRQAGTQLDSSVVTIEGRDRIIRTHFPSEQRIVVLDDACTATITSHHPQVSFVTNVQEFRHKRNLEACENAYVASQLNPVNISTVKYMGVRGISLRYCRVTTVTLSIQ